MLCLLERKVLFVSCGFHVQIVSLDEVVELVDVMNLSKWNLRSHRSAVKGISLFHFNWSCLIWKRFSSRTEFIIVTWVFRIIHIRLLLHWDWLRSERLCFRCNSLGCSASLKNGIYIDQGIKYWCLIWILRRNFLEFDIKCFLSFTSLIHCKILYKIKLFLNFLIPLLFFIL